MASKVSHLNDSIRKVAKHSWLIANTLLLTHYPSPDNIPPDQTCWSDSNGGHFALSSAPEPLLDSKPLAEDSFSISRVHAVDNQAAVWRAGEAFIKAHHIDYPDVTREHVTLQFLKDKAFTILRLIRDTSSLSPGFPASSFTRLGPAWTTLFAGITSARLQMFAIA